MLSVISHFFRNFQNVIALYLVIVMGPTKGNHKNKIPCDTLSMNKVTSSNVIMAYSPSLPRLVSARLTSSVGSFRLSNPLTSLVFIVNLTMAKYLSCYLFMAKY